jgi:hypothetical protein
MSNEITQNPGHGYNRYALISERIPILNFWTVCKFLETTHSSNFHKK